MIREDADGHIDLAQLEEELVRHAGRPLRIGSFSAASNVTGIVSDTRAIASLLHRHGALSFWDFAAAGPYVQIDMGASGDDPLAYKDAIFLSPHKFIGGPGTPGVLVVRRELLRNRVPTVPGGGTVAYVNPTEHRYLDDPVEREEGGTPAIVESIRAGLVFQLKEAVGADTIAALERSFIRRAIDSWGANPSIELLGNLEAERLSIVSFVVRHGTRYLHHNFVVALLNDLFGIQSRGGCSCAGPYGRLLGIDIERSHSFEREIARGCEGIKPGWVRVNFNYFISEVVFEYLLEAVHLVADQGWKLLGDYRFDPASGLWRHRRGLVEPPLRLHALRYDDDGRLNGGAAHATASDAALPGYLDQAAAACWRPAPLMRRRRSRPGRAARPVGRLRGAALVRAPPVPLAVQQPGEGVGVGLQRHLGVAEAGQRAFAGSRVHRPAGVGDHHRDEAQVGPVADRRLDADLGHRPDDREGVDPAVAQHHLQGRADEHRHGQLVEHGLAGQRRGSGTSWVSGRRRNSGRTSSTRSTRCQAMAVRSWNTPASSLGSDGAWRRSPASGPAWPPPPPGRPWR